MPSAPRYRATLETLRQLLRRNRTLTQVSRDIGMCKTYLNERFRTGDLALSKFVASSRHIRRTDPLVRCVALQLGLSGDEAVIRMTKDATERGNFGQEFGPSV